MRYGDTITIAEMRPFTRWVTVCVVLFTVAIPLLGVNLLFRLPNHMWSIFASHLIALAAARLAFVALQRRARSERRRSGPRDTSVPDSI